jgi:hypothetical protein
LENHEDNQPLFYPNESRLEAGAGKVSQEAAAEAGGA